MVWRRDFMVSNSLVVTAYIGLDGSRSLIAFCTSSMRSPVRGCERNTRSEEHTSELQSLMRISYAVFCLKKKKKSSTNLNRIFYILYIPSVDEDIIIEM